MSANMNRSPLKRRVGLKRSGRLRPFRPKTKKSRVEFRKAVLNKNGGWCVRCQMFNTEWNIATDPHHWLPRARGGADNHRNGIPLCRKCHRWVHDNPKAAEATGFLLVRGGEWNEGALTVRAWMELWNGK